MGHSLSMPGEKDKAESARVRRLIRGRIAALGAQMERMDAASALEEIIETLQRAILLISDGHPDKPMYFGTLGCSLKSRFELTGVLSDLETAIENFQQAVSLTPDGHPDKPWYSSNLGISLSSRFERIGHSLSMPEERQGSTGVEELVRETIAALGAQQEDMDEASITEKMFEMFQWATLLVPGGHSSEPMYFSTLGNSLLSRFQHTGMLSDLEAAVEYQQQAVSLTPDGHPDKPGYFNNLGISLASRFERTGVLSDLKAAIENLQQAVLLAPDGHPDKSQYSSNLGNSLESRFERTGVLSDLEAAIKNQQQAVSLTPNDHPDKPQYSSNLGNSLLSRFQRTGVLSDLEAAIKNQQQAASLTPDVHPNKPTYSNNLGNSLKSRFERTGVLSDLEAAIENQQQAVSLTSNVHPNKPAYSNNLGISLSSRFEHTGVLSDLEAAIENKQQAVLLTPDVHPNKPAYLNNLGISLESRFRRTGVVSDLEAAIENQQQAVSLAPDGHPFKPRYSSNLGNSLQSRFERTGVLGDLEAAIENQQQAVSLTPDGHPSKPRYYSSLGNSLLSRFERTGALSDLEAAIKNLQQAVSLMPDGHPSKSWYFSNLGGSFLSRYERTGVLSDLEAAIKNFWHAVLLTPNDHPTKPGYSSNLGNSLQSRFRRTGELSDLEVAIENQQQAVSLTPNGHPNKPRYFNNLGNSLKSRFGRTGVLSDLEAAIENQQQAVSLTPDGHPDKSIYFRNLGSSLKSRFDHTGLPCDLTNAILNLRLAATSNIGPILRQCHASKMWARLEAERDLPAKALVAYRHAIGLLPKLAWIGDPIATRHSQLNDIDDLSREAAAFALDAGHPDLALELLEQGRSVVWNQLVQLRPSVDRLHRANPGLCAEFTRISCELQSAATRGYGLINPRNIENPISLEEETRHHHRLAEKWDLLVQEIRSLPNFEDFLLPKKVSVLMEAASLGPVVVINIHESRCDALVLKRGRDTVLHIPLPKLHYDDLMKMHDLLRQYLENPHRAWRWVGRAGRVAQTMDDSLIADILAQTYSKVIYPILNALGMATARSEFSHLPRIWWCPAGPLTFFPLHAACCTTGTEIYGTFNYAVSSYTPTINALLEARLAKRRSFNRLVGIAMTKTPGQSLLPGAGREIARIQKLFSVDSQWSFEALQDEQATGEQVLMRMETSSWVHFACHAIQDKNEPTRSGFCLHDCRLTIMDIVAKPFGHADLAFLSACQTAAGDEKASDEAVHITAAMLGAGYRNVIGTMWAIPDEAASRVATKVYGILLSGGEPDSDRAAQALHEAVREMRELDHDSYSFWVPFVHYGA